MAFKIEEIKDLAKYAIQKKVPTNFSNVASLEDVECALREACRELAPNIYEYERNKTYIFEIIQVAIDTVLPKRVLATVGQFADVQQFANGQTARFKVKTGRNRAKNFVTRAAVNGVYETFRLDTKYIDVTTMCYGGAAAVDFERYLAGDEDFGEYAAIIMEGLEEAIYKEIYNTLKGAATQFGNLEATNYAAIGGDAAYYTGDDAKNIRDLARVAKAYGDGAMIVAGGQVIEKFTNYDEGFSPNSPTSDLDEMKENGVIGKWKGITLVELPNSYTDETNTKTVFDEGYGFIFPVGRNVKPIKVALEGNTQVDDWKNRDRSMEIQAYRKFGVAIITYNDWCMFVDENITGSH